ATASTSSAASASRRSRAWSGVRTRMRCAVTPSARGLGQQLLDRRDGRRAVPLRDAEDPADLLALAVDQDGGGQARHLDRSGCRGLGVAIDVQLPDADLV